MSGRAQRAFTLAELIVVVGIIALLVATLLPMVNRARVSAKRSRMAMDLNTIAIGLDAYRDDFGDYPRPDEHDYTSRQRGAEALCRALLAAENANGRYADGADGFGFRTRRVNNVPQGKVHGPYLRPESFKLRRNPPDPDTAPPNPLYMLDIDEQPILYYVARATKPNIHLAESFVALSATPPLSPLFNAFDNAGPYDGLYKMRLMLGDVSLDGAINGEETPASTGPYLLWSAGPDGAFGPIPDPRPLTTEERRKLRSKVDDVTNFPFK